MIVDTFLPILILILIPILLLAVVVVFVFQGIFLSHIHVISR